MKRTIKPRYTRRLTWRDIRILAILVIVCLVCIGLAMRAHADSGDPGDDEIVCGQTVCEGPIKARLWLPMIEQGG